MVDWVFLKELLSYSSKKLPSASCKTVITIIVFADNYFTGWGNNCPGILLIDKENVLRGNKNSKPID